MKIALAQTKPILGNFEKNCSEMLSFAFDAKESLGADLVVFPELSIMGYAPFDLLERPELIKNQNKALKAFIKRLPADLGVVIGALHKEKHDLYNSAHFIYKNEIKKTFHKELLPSYDVFYDKRFFSKGSVQKNIFNFKGKKVLVTICEDIWAEHNKKQYASNPLDKVKKVDVLLNLSASPFAKNKQKIRESILKKLSKKLSCQTVYVNQVGAQDEMIFDGQSFATDQNGKITTKLKAFSPDLKLNSDKKEKNPKGYEAIFKTLSLGIADYFKKSGFTKAHLGLSGGIDSALVLALASDALGPENVTGIALPGPYSSKLSFDLAEKISKNLGTNFISHNINSTYKEFINAFEKDFSKVKFGLVQENTQARLRALALMAFANKENSLLLATSNKSELTVGYSTLYGDQCGALMPIGDLLKTEVFGLCKWINENTNSNVIPKKIITRPPTAELRPNQKDSDSLPSYEKLDQSIEKVITKKEAPTSELDHWVLQKSYYSEYKRWQASPVLRVSNHGFGRGRQMPLAHQFKSKD